MFAQSAADHLHVWLGAVAYNVWWKGEDLSLSGLKKSQVSKCCLQLPKGHYTEDGSRLFSEEHLCKVKRQRAQVAAGNIPLRWKEE